MQKENKATTRSKRRYIRGYVQSCFKGEEEYRLFRRNPSVLLPCNPRRTLAEFSWGCMVIVLKCSFEITFIDYSVV